MLYCKQSMCMKQTDNGYCEKHGGRERQEREWAKKTELNESRRTEGRVQKKDGTRPVVLDGTSRGVVAPGQGLSGLARKSEPLPGTNATKSRSEREAARKKRRAERLATRPEKGKSGKSNKEGTGNSKKSRQQKKKNRKRGCIGGRFK